MFTSVASRRVMFCVGTVWIAMSGLIRAQDIPVEYDDKVYIKSAKGHRWFIDPQSSGNWPAAKHGGDDANNESLKIAIAIKGDPAKVGKPVQINDVVALEFSSTTHEGYTRAYVSGSSIYLDQPKSRAAAPEQWWTVLGDPGVVKHGGAVFLRNFKYPNVYLSNTEHNHWVTASAHGSPLRLLLVNPVQPVQIASAPKGTSSDSVTDVVFVENPGGNSTQTVSQSWSLSETQSVQIGRESTNQWEVGVSISTEFETGVFSNNVELSASYGQAVAEQRSQVQESNVQKSVGGEYTAPPRGWAFHIIKIKIPYKVYDATSGGMTLQMRKFSGGLELSRARTIEIPNRNDDGTIEPVALNDVLYALQLYSVKDPDEAKDIVKKGGLLEQWQAKGYVTAGSIPALTTSPGPVPGPGPTPLVKKPAANQAYLDFQMNDPRMNTARKQRVQEMLNNGESILCIAHTPNGGYCVISDKQRFAENIPQQAYEQMNQLAGKGSTVKAIAFSPTGGWSILYDKNGFFNRGVPDEAHAKMGELAQKGSAIKWFTFTPSGGWSILYDDNGYFNRGIPDATHDEIVRLNQQGKTLHQVVFLPDGSARVFSN